MCVVNIRMVDHDQQERGRIHPRMRKAGGKKLAEKRWISLLLLPPPPTQTWLPLSRIFFLFQEKKFLPILSSKRNAGSKEGERGFILLRLDSACACEGGRRADQQEAGFRLRCTWPASIPSLPVPTTTTRCVKAGKENPPPSLLSSLPPSLLSNSHLHVIKSLHQSRRERARGEGKERGKRAADSLNPVCACLFLSSPPFQLFVSLLFSPPLPLG